MGTLFHITSFASLLFTFLSSLRALIASYAFPPFFFASFFFFMCAFPASPIFLDKKTELGISPDWGTTSLITPGCLITLAMVTTPATSSRSPRSSHPTSQTTRRKRVHNLTAWMLYQHASHPLGAGMLLTRRSLDPLRRHLPSGVSRALKIGVSPNFDWGINRGNYSALFIVMCHTLESTVTECFLFVFYRARPSRDRG